MNRLMGLETEYGLYVEGKDVTDLVEEARNIVKSWPGTFGAPWDYREESPLKDLRGFRVAQLATNPQDDRIEKLSRAPRPRTPHEDHVDRVLPNGARLYNDHGHPEYSTTECLSLKDLVAHDKAGERIIFACVQEYAKQTGNKATLYKNNTDFHGMSYGCHENYLMRRDMPFERLINGLLPFLVTRIIFTGAGKVGVEDGSREQVHYQLSQRADFFTELCSVDTLHKRPLINTRDEPHADPQSWRRLHIIAGDANMSEYAIALKLGTTALVLGLLEAGYGPPLTLKDPIQAIRAISHDQTRRWLVETEEFGMISAIDVQRAYLAAAEEQLASLQVSKFAGERQSLEEINWVLREWRAVLEDLETDPQRLANRLDWVAKRQLLESFIEAEGTSWRDDALKSLDLEYHNIDPERGLFYGLQQEGAMGRFVGDDQIGVAMQQPPQNTRAFIRGLCVSRFSASLKAISWGQILLKWRSGPVALDLKKLVDGQIIDVNQELAGSTLKQFVSMIKEANARRR